jgi:hypothetical protein
VDVVILNTGTLPTVLRNDSPGEPHWLQVELRGTVSNRDGVGARVVVEAGGAAQVAEVHSGRSYQSHFGSRLQFGLGAATRVDRISVHWPGGETEVFAVPHVDRRVVLVQGQGLFE